MNGENAVAKIDEPKSLFQFNSFDTAFTVAEKISKSDMVPAAYKGKPIDMVIAWEYGNEVGLKPLQALQNISVVNGRPTVWGDAALAIVKTKADYEYCQESFNETTMTATCKAKRKGEPECVSVFSKTDAETAGLWGRNTWKNYPKRMLQMRARGFAIRDAFPHHFKGIALTEEYIEMQEPIHQSADLTQSEPVETEMLPIGGEEAVEPEPTEAEPVNDGENKAPEQNNAAPAEKELSSLKKLAYSKGVKAGDVYIEYIREAIDAPVPITPEALTREQYDMAVQFFEGLKAD